MVRFVGQGFRPTRLRGDRCGGRSSGLGRSGRLVPHEHSLTSKLSRFGRAKLAAGWTLRRKGLGTSKFFETGAFLRTRDDVSFPNMQFEFLPLARRLEKGKIIATPGFPAIRSRDPRVGS
jgi:hypothetical protein